MASWKRSGADGIWRSSRVSRERSLAMMSLSTAISLAVVVALVALAAAAYGLRLSVQIYYERLLAWPTTALVTATIAALLLVIWAAGLAIAAGLVQALIDPTQPDADPGVLEFVVRIAMLGCCLAAPWVCLKLWLGGAWPQAGQAALTLLIIAVVVNTALFFVVRRYAADAFQVRSGHMAPTICGATAELVCANCGRPYRMAYLPQRPPPPDMVVSCPNCRYNNRFSQRAGEAGADRFVVAKSQPPRRWDAVVLQAADQQGAHLGRVVGMPGEQLDIRAGDLFANGKRLQKLPAKQTDLWIRVHDSQYAPRKLGDVSPHWEPVEKGAHWTTGDGQWRFAAGATAEALRFAGEILDELPYNFGEPLPESDLRIPVGDVRLQCTLGEFSGAGTVAFTWRFGPRQVRALVTARGNVTLDNLGPPLVRAGVSVPAREQGALARGLGPNRQLSFAVRDGAAYLLDGARTAAVLYVAPDDLAADRQVPAATESCRLTISVSGCSGLIARLAIDRDVYYRTVEEVPVSLRNLWRGAPTSTFALNTTNYCILGDNSGRSNDSRFFGPAPRNAFSGVIRWIYWPPARWHELQ